MPELRSRFLTAMNIRLLDSHKMGETPRGNLRLDILGGGDFAGPRLNGEVLAGGSDALLGLADGSVRPDVRLFLRADDGAVLLMTYRGVRTGPPDVMRRLAAEEEVPADAYYLRITPTFETAEPRYDWLNRVVAVGVGQRLPNGVRYDIFEIL